MNDERSRTHSSFPNVVTPPDGAYQTRVQAVAKDAVRVATTTDGQILLAALLALETRLEAIERKLDALAHDSD